METTLQKIFSLLFNFSQESSIIHKFDKRNFLGYFTSKLLFNNFIEWLSIDEW